jgi:hypothetical protein
MKPILVVSIICSITFSIIGCNKSESPTEPITLGKGEYRGTFSVTFKSYKNYSVPLSQSGTISISFSDSAYVYSVIANYSSDTTTNDSLGDEGRYSKSQDKIIMNDGSWMRMDPRWHNSLYLFDTFTIQGSGTQLIISQDNSFAKWQLNLIPKN